MDDPNPTVTIMQPTATLFTHPGQIAGVIDYGLVEPLARQYTPRKNKCKYNPYRYVLIYDGKGLTLSSSVAIRSSHLCISIRCNVSTPAYTRFNLHTPDFFTVEAQTPSVTILSYTISYKEQIAPTRDNLLTLLALWHCTGAEA